MMGKGVSEMGKGVLITIAAFAIVAILMALLLRLGLQVHVQFVPDVPPTNAAISNPAGFCSDDGIHWWRAGADGICYEADKP